MFKQLLRWWQKAVNEWLSMCVNPCMMCNPTETETIYYVYIYIYELLIVIAYFTGLLQHADMNVCYLYTWCHGLYDIHGYTWIYMDIHVCMVPFSLLFSSSIQRCPMETFWSTAVTWPTVALPQSYRRLTPGSRSGGSAMEVLVQFFYGPPGAYEIARLGAT